MKQCGGMGHRRTRTSTRDQAEELQVAGEVECPRRPRSECGFRAEYEARVVVGGGDVTGEEN